MIRYLLIAVILIVTVAFAGSASASSHVLWGSPNGDTYAFVFSPFTLSFIYLDTYRTANILIHNTNTISNFAAVDVVGKGPYLAFELQFIGFSGPYLVYNVFGINFAGTVFLGQFLL